MLNFDEFELGNDLLAALPPPTRKVVASLVQSVVLKVGDTVCEAGSCLRYAYFPVTAVVSLFSPMQNGAGAEVAVIGREGIVGVGTFMGTDKAMSSAVIQHTGTAWRMGARDVAELARDHESVMQALLRYANVLFTNMAQTSACHSHHSLHAQLCSWLLQHLDRQDDDDLYVTQERIAGMLGVRRETVTEGALKLQRDGVIRYQRGLIKVLDREALEKQCCECYGVMNRAFDQLRSSTGAGNRPAQDVDHERPPVRALVSEMSHAHG